MTDRQLLVAIIVFVLIGIALTIEFADGTAVIGDLEWVIGLSGGAAATVAIMKAGKK